MSSAVEANREPVSQGKDELKKWNWGGFLWSWIWAFGHKLWAKGVLALLVSIVIPLVASIYFGLKGNQLAWDQGSYSSKDELRAKERTWVWAWFIVVGFFVALGVFIALAGGFDSN